MERRNVFGGSAKVWLAENIDANAAALAFLEGIPGLSEAPLDADWEGAGFVSAGFTDAGSSFGLASTWRDVTVDEEFDPIDQKLTAQKTEIKYKAAEGTIENLSKVIAGSSLTNLSGRKVLRFGSPLDSQVKEFMVGIQGPSAEGPDTRVIAVWRAKNLAATETAYKKDDEVMFDVNFTALADSDRARGERGGFLVDFENVATGS